MYDNGLIFCAVTAAALDLCILILIIASYREKSSSRKRWKSFSSDMELFENGRSYYLGCDEVLIGRHGSADMRLHDMSVSRYHAIMTITDGVWTITDIGSKSGIYVNGRPVKQKKLHENDIITLGSRRLVFRKRRDKKK